VILYSWILTYKLICSRGEGLFVLKTFDLGLNKLSPKNRPFLPHNVERSADQYLGVSRRELMEQMIDFHNLEYSGGMRKMFYAYKDWEIRYRDGKRSAEEAIQLAKENFDCIARVADGYIDSGSIEVGMVLAVELPKSTPGPISKFYRESISYQPFDPNMN